MLMTDEENTVKGSLQLEATEPLLSRGERIREVICGQNGLLAWACFSTFLAFVFGATLVRTELHHSMPCQMRSNETPVCMSAAARLPD